ncbi:MAG: aldo/keto reductase [Chitinophagaceae bacterium]|nr:aldo/keto reductase [Chitinophagaceae bacterium]
MDYLTPNPDLYNIPFLIDSYKDMPYVSLGGSGLRVPVVGLGTWKMGYPDTGDGSRVNEQQSLAILDRAAELGVCFWDTANRYNNASGNSERIIGNWFQQNPGDRRNIIVATKAFGGMDGFTPNHCRLSRSNILESVYASLERLQTDYIDLLYFHSYEGSTPAEESLTAIEDLVKQDLIRYFGVSNFTVENLESYKSVQNQLSIRCRVVAVQNQFDPLNGEAEKYRGVLNYAHQEGISFVAWSPLAKGLLSEKYLHMEKIGEGDRLYDEGDLKKPLDKIVIQKLNRLASLARQWELTLSQLALAWLLSLPGMGPIIPSSSSVKQLEENADVGKVRLNTEQLQQINDVLSTT